MSRQRLTLIVIVAAVIGAVYALDVLLERAEKTEMRNQARDLYAQGAHLLAAGRVSEALEPLQRACAQDRRNRQYQLAYAEALAGAGRNDDAVALLNDIVHQAPNDGQANLLLARLARKRNDFDNEAAYFHRAIYGIWDANTTLHANEARLEWIRELIARGDRKRLLAELLPLEAATRDPEILRQTAQYLIVAGAPVRSAELYRTLIQSSPGDASLEAGLGHANAAAGEYVAAQRAYARAFRLKPGDVSIRHDMQLASALAAIDPTPRRLTSREKYGRSKGILRLVRDSLVACGSHPTALADADRAINVKKPEMSNEAAEGLLGIAESLWRERPPACPVPEVLPVLMRKLADTNMR